jgi:hypothetical protein
MENTLVKFKEDQRITPWHISLYFALFHIWNSVHFRDEINIRREELMSLSKIGSANTYTKCLKQLNDWKYIKYTPSKSRFVSSKVHMYRFDTTSDTTCDNTPDTSPDNTSVHLVRPFLNNTKHKENNSKQYKTREARKDELHSPNAPRKTQKRFSPPPLDEIIKFFKEKKASNEDAEKFFNHFESNGWKVGGKTKMKDWQAAARNWIKRSEEFKNQKNQTSSRLKVNESKNYDIPL